MIDMREVVNAVFVVVVLVLTAATLAAMSAAGAWQLGHPTPAAATPAPTPCRVLYVADDGQVKCWTPPSFGMEPNP